MSMYGIKKIFKTKLTEVSTSDQEGVGCLRFEGPNVYKYVKYDKGAGSVASGAGKPCGYKGDSDSVVTCDLSDATGGFAGICTATIADAGYGWIQIYGRYASAVTSGTVNAGSAVAFTADGALTALDDTYAAADLTGFAGVALTTAASNKANIFIKGGL